MSAAFACRFARAAAIGSTNQKLKRLCLFSLRAIPWGTRPRHHADAELRRRAPSLTCSCKKRKLKSSRFVLRE